LIDEQKKIISLDDKGDTVIPLDTQKPYFLQNKAEVCETQFISFGGFGGSVPLNKKKRNQLLYKVGAASGLTLVTILLLSYLFTQPKISSVKSI